jgi:hypothetical protein
MVLAGVGPAQARGIAVASAGQGSTRGFYAGFANCAWLAVLIGFYPSVAMRWDGSADYPAPPILQLHVFATTGWLVLLSLQIGLARSGRIDWHRRFGTALIALVPAILVTGIGAEIYSQRFYGPKYPENLRFFIAPLVEMAGFAVAATAAWLMRTKPAAHKRLIVVATAILLVAPYNRMLGDSIYALLGDGFAGMILRTFVGPNLLILAAVLFDAIHTGKVHRVYALTLATMLPVELAASAIYHSPAWPGIVRQMVGL